MRNSPKKKRLFQTGMFRFKKLDSHVLLTNDVGDFIELTPNVFRLFREGRLSQRSGQYRILTEKCFVHSQSVQKKLVERFRMRHSYIWQGPTLHIVVVTRRCDHACLYCQASAVPMATERADMDVRTARAVVDRIMESPSQVLTIEFQGGEPLANWKCIQFMIAYAEKRAVHLKKHVKFAMTSNFTFMSKRKLDFLVQKNVMVCTSLDGPASIHDAFRIKRGGGSFSTAARWLKRAQVAYTRAGKAHLVPSALATITKRSLGYPEDIIDTYVSLGLHHVFLRPLTPLGRGDKFFDTCGFTPEEYVAFYRKAFAYILKLNTKGFLFYESLARYFLIKMLQCREPNFLDVRSPCGAGIGQLLYHYDGRVFACDEGRMLSEMGDDTFCLGDVFKNSLNDFVNSDVIGALCSASLLDNLPQCADCVYKPYCGVCPICNYALCGNIFRKSSFRCSIYMGVLDTIVRGLRQAKTKEVLQAWVNA